MTDLELNTAIAALLGAPKTHEWDTTGQCNHYGSIYECSRCGDVELTDSIECDGNYPCIPPYATDLNRAVAAGRTLGMFEYGVVISPHNDVGGALVQHCYTYYGTDCMTTEFELLAYDLKSPARAVCVAILKFRSLLSERKIIGDGDHAWL